MARSFEANLWYKVQRLRWNDLVAAGWRISKTRHEATTVSISMENEAGFRAAFSVPRGLDIRDIHTRLLTACEQFAAQCEVTA